MTTFVIVIHRGIQELTKAQEIVEGLPTFNDVLDGGFSRLIGNGHDGIMPTDSGIEFGILAYEFRMDEAEFLYLRLQIEETILCGSVLYFQQDIFGHLHQLA